MKKMVLVFLLLSLAGLNICIYLNSYYYNRAKKHVTPGMRIALLQKARRFCPTNDMVFYELGKSYFDLGMESLGIPGAAVPSFKQAAESFKRELRINPAFPYGHYYLGQSFLHLDLLSKEDGAGYIGEFRKAAMLAGDDHQIYRDVGQLFLSRWPNLSEEERRFTLDALNRTMARRDTEEIARFMEIWELNSKDYRIMDQVLPADASVYRQYAEFLGEKGLSLEQRHKYLSLAETLEFERAKRDYQLGENLLSRFQFQDAFVRLKLSLDRLRNIRFYQNLHTEKPIDRSEYFGLLKSNLLGLARCRIEGGSAWEEFESYLLEYLALEDRAASVGELEIFLKDRGIISGAPGRSSSDPSRIALELLILFKQNKYREIIVFGRDLLRGFMVVPEAERPDYARVLLLIGDSLQKVDFLYDAGDFYQKALDIDPDNLEGLLKIRQNYVRLNAEQKLRELDRTIERLVAPSELSLGRFLLGKGRTYSRSLVFDGQNISIDLEFVGVKKEEPPIIAVFFNGLAVWEDAVREGRISLLLTTKAGENILRMKAINRPVSLGKFMYCHR